MHHVAIGVRGGDFQIVDVRPAGPVGGQRNGVGALGQGHPYRLGQLEVGEIIAGGGQVEHAVEQLAVDVQAQGTVAVAHGVAQHQIVFTGLRRLEGEGQALATGHAVAVIHVGVALGIGGVRVGRITDHGDSGIAGNTGRGAVAGVIVLGLDTQRKADRCGRGHY